MGLSLLWKTAIFCVYYGVTGCSICFDWELKDEKQYGHSRLHRLQA